MICMYWSEQIDDNSTISKQKLFHNISLEDEIKGGKWRRKHNGYSYLLITIPTQFVEALEQSKTINKKITVKCS